MFNVFSICNQRNNHNHTVQNLMNFLSIEREIQKIQSTQSNNNDLLLSVTHSFMHCVIAHSPTTTIREIALSVKTCRC